MIKKTAQVILNARNVSFYKNLGYEIPNTSILKNSQTKFGYGKGATIEVEVIHLSVGSKTKVQRTCDKCGRIDLIPWREMGSTDFCKKCSTQINAIGAKNPFFGKTHTKEAIEKIKAANYQELPEQEIISFIEQTGYAPTSNLVVQKFSLNRQTLLNIINRNNRRDLLFAHMSTSSFETALTTLVRENYTGEIRKNDRSVLAPKELDLYLPELKMAFEFNGLYWHSEDKLGKKYHAEKFKQCEAAGIQLFTIWEHVYNKNPEAVNQFITNLLQPKTKIFARKCQIIQGDLVKKFIEKWHLQGTAPAHTYLGLSHNGEIVMAVSVSNHHRSGTQSQVLSRVCFSKYEVIGGLEKLLKHCPRPLLTWSDNCYSPLGNMYKKHGFSLVQELPPDYFYSKGDGTFFSKQSQAKKKVNCPSDLTEKTFAQSKGLFRIWDCGKRCWKLP